MLQTIRNAWKIADLRKKILYTIFVIILFRLGSVIPVPFIDGTALKELFHPASQSTLGDPAGLFNFLNVMAGGALANASIFAMSIGPYITASIIMQLLAVAIPALERMQKEGEEGKKRIAQITRVVTIVLGLVEGFAYYTVIANEQGIVKYPNNWFAISVIVMSFAAGTAIIMWLGEKINEKGIGNGISMILFASIVSSGPQLIAYIWSSVSLNKWYLIPIILIAAIAVVVFIVILNQSERRISVQYAKRVVGRKMYGGQSTHLPLKVIMSGVMPIIFANSFVMLPLQIANFFPGSGFQTFVTKWFNYDTIAYAVVYFILIIAFNYFYVSIQYNPIEIANNLQKNGGSIMGIRPGKPTSLFIKRVLNKITLIGALALGLIAVLPIILSAVFKINISIGGTSILIVVGVILETMQVLESQMMARHYKGFLE